MNLPPVDSTWKHHNGNLYRVVMHTNTESDRAEYPTTIVYTNVVNGTNWSRAATEWSRSFTQVILED